MADADVTSRRSPRSPATLTYEHLRRLAALADADHDAFTRPGGRPEYRSRRLTIVLAQGAALHYFDGHTGVKIGSRRLDVLRRSSGHAISGRQARDTRRFRPVHAGTAVIRLRCGRQWARASPLAAVVSLLGAKSGLSYAGTSRPGRRTDQFRGQGAARVAGTRCPEHGHSQAVRVVSRAEGRRAPSS